MAALVNGDPITLAEYELEISRYEQARSGSGIDLATSGGHRALILEGLIDLVLLAQDARANGSFVDDTTLERKVANIAEIMGGMDKMNIWLEQNRYSLDQYKANLALEMLAAETTGQIIAGLPDRADHVRARHVLFASREDAEWALGQLRSGADFAEFARGYSIDRSTAPAGGDLGWIPEGLLPWSELDEALFALEPGAISGIVETQVGFHILQVTAKENRRLSFEALQMRREQAVGSWIEDRRAASDIQVFITP